MKRKPIVKRLLAKRPILTAAAIAIITVGIVWGANRNNNAHDSNKLQVTASFYPLYDFAKQVGGDKVHVTNITPAGAEPHDYEPSPKTLVDARKAKVFIYNGGTLEPWTDSFLGDYKNVAVQASKGITLHEGEEHSHGEEKEEGHDEEEGEVLDPHFWLDPELARQIVLNIRDGLAKADPDNRATYEANAKRYIAQLTKLDQAFVSGLANCTHDTIITAHDAFGYLAARYNFTAEAIAGLSPDMEPSAARLAELSDHVREEDIDYVFFESLVSPRLADTIATETGAKTLVLDPIEGLTDEDQQQGKDYISVQRQNLANLRTALACQ